MRELGRKDSINGSAVLDIDKMHLVLNAAGELSGTVTVDNRSIAVADMLSNRWNDIPTAVASEAVSTLRKSLADAARYRGFARYISGDSTTVKLANKLLTLEISNKGGMISRATLNDYNSYDSTRIELMSPESDSY